MRSADSRYLSPRHCINDEIATGFDAARTPIDSELDVYGLTDTGLTRITDQDHFLISSLQRSVVVHPTSLPPSDTISTAERRAGPRNGSDAHDR